MTLNVTSDLMQLQVLLPSSVFAEYTGVSRIVLQTPQGEYGLLPNRLDCVAIIEPGILSYVLENGEPSYLALDEGVLVKVGKQVRVSIRNAYAEGDLAQLQKKVSKEFVQREEVQREVRATLARLESGFMRGFNNLHQR